jgi:hypothetical protein
MSVLQSSGLRGSCASIDWSRYSCYVPARLRGSTRWRHSEKSRGGSPAAPLIGHSRSRELRRQTAPGGRDKPAPTALSRSAAFSSTFCRAGACPCQSGRLAIHAGLKVFISETLHEMIVDHPGITERITDRRTDELEAALSQVFT